MSEALFDQIETLRRRLGIHLCIMGHHYQSDEIIRHCDYVGDSLELSRTVPTIEAEHIVFCGVSFMGESAALLTKKGQKVYLPDADAHCMMALMASGSQLSTVLEACQKRKKVIPLAYVNTSASLKACVGAFGGAVCTSANAKKMLSWALEASDTVFFLPDRHLARNTARDLGLSPKEMAIVRLSSDGIADLEELLSTKRLLIWPGCCPIHAQMTETMVAEARDTHPGCKVLVHPECPPEVVQASDGQGSTSFLIKEAGRLAESGVKELCIGTEVHLVRRLAKKYAPTIHIFPLLPATCPDMQAVTEEKLAFILNAIENGSAASVELEDKDRVQARESLERMLTVCA